MSVPRMRSRVLGVAAALTVVLGGGVVSAASASAATAYQNELCSYGTYISFLSWAFTGSYMSTEVAPGQCVSIVWPNDYGAVDVWGVYSADNYFLIGAEAAEGDIATYGDEGPGDYSFRLF